MSAEHHLSIPNRLSSTSLHTSERYVIMPQADCIILLLVLSLAFVRIFLGGTANRAMWHEDGRKEQGRYLGAEVKKV